MTNTATVRAALDRRRARQVTGQVGPVRAWIEGKLARQALELDCTPEEEQSLFGELEERFAHLRAEGRLILYADDAAPLVEELRARDGSSDRALVVRPANLEDVFLATTGTLLWEDE